MRVQVIERGARPKTLTKARKLVPEAAKFLAKLFEDKTFADQATIVLDWPGDMNWSGDGPMPDDLRVPVLYLVTEKWYPNFGRWLKVDYALEIEEMFGRDNATSEDLYEVVQLMEERVRQAEQERGS